MGGIAQLNYTNKCQTDAGPLAKNRSSNAGLDCFVCVSIKEVGNDRTCANMRLFFLTSHQNRCPVGNYTEWLRYTEVGNTATVFWCQPNGLLSGDIIN